jgi:hypothetical protein
MNLDFTYQLDSIKEVRHLELNQLTETGGLRIERSELLKMEMVPVRGKEIVGTEKKVTGSQVRKNWWQHEQKFLVGNSRYIEPLDEIELAVFIPATEGLHLPERPFNQITYDWVTLLLLLALALFASVKVTWGKYISSLFQSIINYSTSLRMFQEKNNSLLQGAFQLDVLFYIIFSVFFFQILIFFRINLTYQHFNLYLFCLALVIIYFVTKNSIYRFIGAILEKKGETGEFLYNSDNFKRVAGLILLPVVAIISFYPYSHETIPVYAGIVVVLLIYSLLIIRGFTILLKKQFSIFYLFLYFCTLEFLPLVLLYKILVV